MGIRMCCRQPRIGKLSNCISLIFWTGYNTLGNVYALFVLWLRDYAGQFLFVSGQRAQTLDTPWSVGRQWFERKGDFSQVFYLCSSEPYLHLNVVFLSYSYEMLFRDEFDIRILSHLSLKGDIFSSDKTLIFLTTPGWSRGRRPISIINVS